MLPKRAQPGKSITVQVFENHILLLCPPLLGVGWLSLSLRGGSSVCTGVILKTPAHPCLEVKAGCQPGPQWGSRPKQLEVFTWPGLPESMVSGFWGQTSQQKQTELVTRSDPASEVTWHHPHLVTSLPDFKGIEHRPRYSKRPMMGNSPLPCSWASSVPYVLT